MPKHETRNAFYQITWKVNSLVITFGQFMSYCKKKCFSKKFHKKNIAWKLVPISSFSFTKDLAQYLLKNEVFESNQYY